MSETTQALAEGGQRPQQVGEPYLVVENLRKSFGSGGSRVDVLRGISCTVSRGEMCVLLGPSGSGKSTFLNLIGGLEPADGGSIRVGSTEVTGLRGNAIAEYRRRELGFVFQFYNLLPTLTIRENIEVCGYLSDSPLDVDDLMARLGIWEQRRKLPRQVSGGQQQRCAIARALAKNPGMLLCDEPTGALDYETSKEVLGVLEQVNQEMGVTMLIVTHNEAIAQMSHRELRLREGRIVTDRVNESPARAADLVW